MLQKIKLRMKKLKVFIDVVVNAKIKLDVLTNYPKTNNINVVLFSGYQGMEQETEIAFN